MKSSSVAIQHCNTLLEKYVHSFFARVRYCLLRIQSCSFSPVLSVNRSIDRPPPFFTTTATPLLCPPPGTQNSDHSLPWWFTAFQVSSPDVSFVGLESAQIFEVSRITIRLTGSCHLTGTPYNGTTTFIKRHQLPGPIACRLCRFHTRVVLDVTTDVRSESFFHQLRLSDCTYRRQVDKPCRFEPRSRLTTQHMDTEYTRRKGALISYTRIYIYLSLCHFLEEEKRAHPYISAIKKTNHPNYLTNSSFVQPETLPRTTHPNALR